MKNLITVISMLTMLSITATTYAADSGSSSGGGYDENVVVDINDYFGKARQFIGAGEYKKAIRELNTIIRTDYRNADAWNLIGYSNRKLGKFRKAGKAYRKALKYDPQHKGALEYQGQLYVNLNELDKAQANRDRLVSLCPAGCAELDSLNAALAAIN